MTTPGDRGTRPTVHPYAGDSWSPLPPSSQSTVWRQTLATGASPIAVSLPIAPGWWCVQVRDAFVTFEALDTRTGLDAGGELARGWRLGPASRVWIPVTDQTRFRYTVKAILSGVTVDPTTGVQSTAAATPQITVWWEGLHRPTEDSRSGFAASATALAGTASITAAAPCLFYPPGWSRRLQVVALPSVVLSVLDGPDAAAVGELPAARSHVLEAVDPWSNLQLSVAAGTATAWISWGDR